MDLCSKRYAIFGPQAWEDIFYEGSEVSHVLCLPSPPHVAVTETQRPILFGTGVIESVLRRKSNMKSECLRYSGFKFTVALFLFWLLSIATEPRMPYYLIIVDVFEFIVFSLF